MENLIKIWYSKYILNIFLFYETLDKVLTVPRMINIKQKCFLRFLLRVYVKEVSLKLITGIVLKEEKKKEKGNDDNTEGTKKWNHKCLLAKSV